MRPIADKLVVLDLDQTLIYASMFSLERATDVELGLAHGYRRPGARAFVRACLERFRHVGVWTAATMEYATDAVAAVIDDPSRLSFVWAREQCTRAFDDATGEEYWAKDLAALQRAGHGLASIIVVDDDLVAWGEHRDNVLLVSKYRGALDDGELDSVLLRLDDLASAEDVRPMIAALRPVACGAQET